MKKDITYTLLVKPDTIAELPIIIDSDRIANFLSKINESFWYEDMSRKEKYQEHTNTDTIPILSVNLDLTYFFLEDQKKHPVLYEPIVALMKDCLDYLQNLYDGVIHKILLVKLKSNSSIPLHADSGFALQYTRRIHIPIVTNENVFFTVEDKTVNMKKGYLYEINNLKKHAVDNNSDHDRIHMIVDVIGNKTIKECIEQRELIHSYT
jgi:hypothetical protein